MAGSSFFKSVKGYLTWDNIAFTLILLGLFFYLFVQIGMLHTSDPQVAVKTTSMVPTYEGFDLTRQGDIPIQYYDILRGDLLIVANVVPQVGDVIIFHQANESIPVVHRLIATETINGTTYYATKGDHNSYTDAGDLRGNQFGWIERSQIIGVVVFSIHHVGWFMTQLQNPFIQAFFFVAALVIVVILLIDFVDEKEKPEIQKTIRRKIYFMYKKKKIQINKPKLFAFFIIGLTVFTYFGIGWLNYTTGTNSVTWVRDNVDEKAGIIDLNSPYPFFTAEQYNNTFLYNILILINSSGSLNFVSKVAINPVFNSSFPANPSYVWTIVYDYYGSKLIHAVLIFNIPQSFNSGSIATILKFTVYSAGLLASSPIVTTIPVQVLV